MDYRFMSGQRENETGESEGAEAPGDDDVTEMKILAIRDARSRVCAALPVAQKRVGVDERSVEQCLRVLEFLG